MRHQTRIMSSPNFFTFQISPSHPRRHPHPESGTRHTSLNQSPRVSLLLGPTGNIPHRLVSNREARVARWSLVYKRLTLRPSTATRSLLIKRQIPAAVWVVWVASRCIMHPRRRVTLHYARRSWPPIARVRAAMYLLHL